MASRRDESAKHTKKLSAAASAQELHAYFDACESAKIDPASTLRRFAEAVVEHVDKHGSFTFPIRFSQPRKSGD